MKTVNTATVRNVISKAAEKDLHNITDSTHLFSDGILDSLNAIDIIESLEIHFDIYFDVGDLTDKNFRSIESIADVVGQVLARSAA